ncbi:hypothetical protein CC86DRAFT_141392 [Ophiobolus disseminans]|uniref:F-box domain-containing protein n=1 Tax=Ophiobolus disseminans TaxID=1469910 RepID=A0A6A7AFX6_9PLEO|nr:hypothetical protein CC86DRAFT_141392 [Ophiobolus disseminans]
MAHPSAARIPHRFSILPVELFLHVLDQLVATHCSLQPIAYGPSNAITQTLRTLTLVSHDVYLIASRYLYLYCLYLNNCTNYTRLRRTLGLNLGYHPQALRFDQASRNDELFAGMSRHISSAFISPLKSEQDCGATPMVRLPQVIDLCKTIGLTLKRLALDLQPIYASASEVELVRPHLSEKNIFLHMPHLEELVSSYNVLDYFPYAPPNLRRLAITFQELKDTQLDFCFSTSSLQTLIFLRPPELLASDVELLFSSYKGRSLDVVLVDVNSNHRTPTGTRTWKDDDAVRVWELDVPTSFYGDEDELILCDDYMWTHGVNGTLWTQSKRRMVSWADIQRRLAGPVHLIMDAMPS